MRRMERFNHYKDSSDADKWLTKFQLGRSTPASERLLQLNLQVFLLMKVVLKSVLLYLHLPMMMLWLFTSL